jgi:hypothetical protein
MAKAIDVLIQAVRAGDARTAGRAVDILRAAGCTYWQVFGLVQVAIPDLSYGAYDALLGEADEGDAED